MNPDQFERLIHAIDSPNWAEVATLVIFLLSMIAAVVTILYARAQLLADHERSRRQYAIEMCIKWSNFTAPETSSVTRLIETLDDTQCTAIVNLTKLEIEAKHKDHLINILELRFPEIERQLGGMLDKSKKEYIIDGRYLLYIRYIAVRYLNMIESILVSWSSGVADKQVIEREFSFLYDPTRARSAMARFREKLGAGSHPALDKFLEVLKERSKPAVEDVTREPLAARTRKSLNTGRT
ncbi:MAG TPA: hypothetical protein VN930_11065 [Xanthobacteraceae bacterium]|nr:hypothetical protein [Xanthobacteraceae bacterium]